MSAAFAAGNYALALSHARQAAASGGPLAAYAQYYVGLSQLRLFHVNDSLKPRGSRVDRHAHLGRGCLGLEAFRLLVNDRRFRDLRQAVYAEIRGTRRDPRAAGARVDRGGRSQTRG